MTAAAASDEPVHVNVVNVVDVSDLTASFSSRRKTKKC